MDFYKNRKYLSILAMVLILAWLFLMDYKDLSWQTNAGAYLGITSMVLVIVSNFLVKKKENNQ